MTARHSRKALKLGPLLSVAAGLATLAVLIVPPWHAPVDGHQLGYRASSMVQWDQTVPAAIALDKPPVMLPASHFGVDAAALQDKRPATEAYKNLQVVKDVSAGDFMALQVALTNWVAPKEGCAFCHAPAAGTPAGGAALDFASDAKPQKAAARTMIQMTRTLNADWRSHVGEAGVTCYSCHRGQNVPPSTWYPRAVKQPRPFIARQDDWLETATTVRDFFPDAGFAEYLLQDTPGRGQSYTALHSTGPADTIVVKRLYEVMMQMSDGIGVNCGYCHNSRAFFDWGQSTPARWAGLEGIHMTQAINNGFLLPLVPSIPQTREIQGNGRPPITPASESGPQPGNGLATCQTCHYENPRPLHGQNLLAPFPALAGPSANPAGAGARP